MPEIRVLAEEKDDNKSVFIAVYNLPADQPRVVGNALIFIEKDTGTRIVLPLSSYRRIAMQQVSP